MLLCTFLAMKCSVNPIDLAPTKPISPRGSALPQSVALRDMQPNSNVYKLIGQIMNRVGDDLKEENVEEFGRRLDISGDGKFLAVGSKIATSDGGEKCTVNMYEFIHASSKWIQITGSPLGAAEHCFDSLSLSSDGSMVAIGSSGNGEVQIYGYSEERKSWELNETIFEKMNDTTVQFGYSVDLSRNGNRVAIAANGYVQVYECCTNTSWFELGNNVSIGQKGNFVYERALSISGTGNRFCCWNEPHVKCFLYEDGDWSQFGLEIEISMTGTSNDTFSMAMSYDGMRVTVGISSLVRMYSYSYDGVNAWSQLGDDFFGNNTDYLVTSVDASYGGDVVAVGASHKDVQKGGHVFLYGLVEDASGKQWEKLADYEENPSENYVGVQVVMTSLGTRVAIGVPKSNNENGRVMYVTNDPWFIGDPVRNMEFEGNLIKIEFKFPIGGSKLFLPYMDATLYNEQCEDVMNEDAIYIEGKQTPSIGFAAFHVVLNTTKFNDTQNAQKHVSFCTKLELLDSKNSSISFKKNKVSLNFDLSVNFNSTTVTLNFAETIEETSDVSYSIKACQCSLFECISATVIEQADSGLILCLTPNSTNVKISNYELSLTKGNEVYKPVIMDSQYPDPVYDSYTSAGLYENTYMVNTRVPAHFFNEGSQVQISGKAIMEFKSMPTNKRRFTTNYVPFQTSIYVEASNHDTHMKPNFLHSSLSFFISVTYSFISSIAFVVLQFI